MNKNLRLFKNTSVYAIGDILPKVLSLILLPILTSKLSPKEYGIIHYINTIDIFLSVLSVFGLNTFFLVYYYKVEGEKLKKQLMGNISLAIIILSLFLSILLHLIGPWLFKIWGSSVSFYPYISIGIFTNFSNVITFMPSCLFRVQERPIPLTILNVIKSFSIMISSLLAVTIFNGQALEVLQMKLYISVVFGLVFIVSVRNHLLLNINIRQLKLALKFSLPLVPGAFSFYLFSLFDRILIDKFLSLKDLGIYSTAATLALMLNIVSNGAYKAFEPYFFQNIDKPDFNQKFKNVRDWLLLVILFCSLCISVFSKEFFIILSSSDYWTSYKYVPIIMIGVISSSISLMFSTVIIAKGKTMYNTIITFIGSFLSISLNIIFLKHYGIIASASIFAITFTLVMIANIRVANLKIPHFRQIAASLFVIAASISITFLVHLDSIIASITIKFLLINIVLFITCLILKINPIIAIVALRQKK